VIREKSVTARQFGPAHLGAGRGVDRGRVQNAKFDPLELPALGVVRSDDRLQTVREIVTLLGLGK